jgi:DNA helicase II / ATP-dependent DNA helicase PcrA
MVSIGAMGDSPTPLNAAQREAVARVEGRLLVLAGAGTGKTRVIEERTAALLARGVEPQQILLMTFTRKAASEMLARAAGRHPLARRVDGGTFHHVAYRIVARHFGALGFPRAPTMIDGDDAANAIAAVIERLGVGRDKRARLPKKDALQAAFSRATNLRVPLEEVVARDLPEFHERLPVLQQVRRAWVDYKLARGYVDFDDVMVMAVKLLEQAELRARIACPWRFVLVDEYQDVNAWQAAMAELIAAPHGNLMVVGDPKQSIYGFRGARYEKIAGFANGAAATHVVHLTDNYRSTQAILDVANAVMRQMRSTIDRELRAAAQPPGPRPTLQVVEDARGAADLVADLVQERLADPGALGGHAVLVRNTYQSVPLQGELLRRKIPFVVYGGLRFTEAAHIKDVLAGLRVVHNPTDELAWLRLLQLLAGVGPTTAARLFADFSASEGEGDPLERAQRLGPARIGAKGREGFVALLGTLLAARDTAAPLGAYDRLVGWYRGVMQARYPGEGYREQDLSFFRIVVERYADLQTLLADLTLDPDVTRQASGGGPSEVTEGLRPLTISTIHSAKGLEWDHVLLLGLDDQTLPSPWAVKRQQVDGGENELEEEKRLLYVAITRARRQLDIVHTLFGRHALQRLSRFLDHPSVQGLLEVRSDPHSAPAPEGGGRIDRDDLLAALAGEDFD